MKLNIFILASFAFIFGCSSPKTETSDEKPETKSDDNDYYENGNIRIERKRLENGDSLWIFRQEDGGCWEEDFYRDGELYKKIVYNSDCSKSAEYELKDGKRHGEWINYQENGKIWTKGNYQNGIPEGSMFEFDEEGKQIGQDFHVMKDSIPYPLFLFENELSTFRKMLSGNGIKFIEDENIEVAGKQDYHFPILRWEGTELNFDMIERNDTIRCLSGKIMEHDLTVFKGITTGTDLTSICQHLKMTAPQEISNLYVYDQKEKMTYRFEFENKKLVAFYFERTGLAY